MLGWLILIKCRSTWYEIEAPDWSPEQPHKLKEAVVSVSIISINKKEPLPVAKAKFHGWSATQSSISWAAYEAGGIARSLLGAMTLAAYDTYQCAYYYLLGVQRSH